ncbi:hypothetical protein [Burkholderia ambifaria]|nr:hypothetical protein [Burkholderia ambifaria]
MHLFEQAVTLHSDVRLLFLTARVARANGSAALRRGEYRYANAIVRAAPDPAGGEFPDLVPIETMTHLASRHEALPFCPGRLVGDPVGVNPVAAIGQRGHESIGGRTARADVLDGAPTDSCSVFVSTHRAWHDTPRRHWARPTAWCGTDVACAFTVDRNRLGGLSDWFVHALRPKAGRGRRSEAGWPDVANSVYFVDGVVIRLKNGKRIQPLFPRRLGVHVTELVGAVVRGEMNGKRVTLAILADDPGVGRPTFYLAALVDDAFGAPTVYLGADLTPESIAIESDEAVLTYRKAGPRASASLDGAATAMRRFKWVGGRLMEKRVQVIDTGASPGLLAGKPQPGDGLRVLDAMLDTPRDRRGPMPAA